MPDLMRSYRVYLDTEELVEELFETGTFSTLSVLDADDVPHILFMSVDGDVYTTTLPDEDGSGGTPRPLSTLEYPLTVLAPRLDVDNEDFVEELRQAFSPAWEWADANSVPEHRTTIGLRAVMAMIKRQWGAS